MKHLKLFFALFAMLALGVGNAWGAEEETDTYDFKTNGVTKVSGPNAGNVTSSSGSVVLKSKTGNTTDTWTIIFTGSTAYGYGKSTGIYFGTNSYAPNAQMTSKSYNYVSQVDIVTTTSNTSYKIGVKVGGSSFGEKTLGSCTSQTQTFTSDATTGAITISVTSSNQKQVKIEKVIITYGSAPATSDPVDPTATFSNGSYTVGQTLDLSTLWTSNSDGAVTYTIDNAGTTGASINGKSFTATAAGSCTVKASQAATSAYNAIEKTATITVTAPIPATVTLSEAGAVTNVADKNVGDSYTLPSTSTQTCGTKTFVGWSTVEIATPGDKPTSNFYEPGTTVTLVEEQKFYAVYAISSGTPETWEQTTSVAVGDLVVIAQVDDGTKEMTGLGKTPVTDNNNYGTGTDFTTNPNGTLVWTVEEGNAPGQFSFNNGSYYLNLGSDNNYLSYSITKNANSSWTVSTEDERAVVANANLNTRKIMWNKNNTRFASYTKSHGNNSGQYYYHIVFYKKSGGISYSDYTTSCSNAPAATLVSIAHTGDKTTFTEGDAFVKSTITATYDDATTKDVTSLATFEGYDMNTTGDQTVNVSYTEGDKTATTTYAITVNPKPTYTITWNNAGSTTETKVVQGAALGELSTVAECPSGKKFMGWTAAAEVNNDGSDIVYVKETDIPKSDMTYYAVFAVVEGGEGTPTTATVSIANYADAKSWADKQQYLGITVDENITATATGGGNTGKYYTNGENWRLYQNENATLTISAAEGYEIQTVTVTYTVDNTGVLTLEGSNVVSGTENEINAASVTFSVGNTGSATNGQVRITAIEVVYALAAETSDFSLDCTIHTEPTWTISKDAIDFADKYVDVSYTETFTISASNLTYDIALAIDGSNFTVSPTSIATDAEFPQTVTVTYAPAAAGSHYATLNITSGSTLSKAIALTGSATEATIYTLTALADINPTDKVIIVGTSGGNTYAMSNDKGASDAPDAITVTVIDNKIATDKTNILWNIAKDGDNLTIYPADQTAKWLYCLADENDGVRVGTGNAKEFTIDKGYLYTTQTTYARHIGIYNNSDWRCYKPSGDAIANNIKDQSFAFYVLPDTKPSISATPASKDFGVLTVNETATQEIEITALNITQELTAEITGDGFTKSEIVDNKITITFAPTEVKEYSATLTISAGTEASASVTLAGEGVAAAYSVTYNKNGAEGNAPTDETKYVAGSKVTVAGQGDMTMAGYRFAGWKYGENIYKEGTQFTMPAEDVTFMAQWVEKEDFSTGYWVLVTDASKLNADDYVVIAAADYNVAMKSYETGNNCKQVEVTKVNNLLTWNENVGVFQLDKSDENYTFQDVNTEQYLYAAGGTSSNYLRAADEIPADENAKKYTWTISITDNKATIKAQIEDDGDKKAHNWLRYNNTESGKLFSCYDATSTQKDIALYKYVTELPTPTPDHTRNVPVGYYATMCLPNAISKYEGAEIYEVAWMEFKDDKAVGLYLDQVAAGTTLVAGKPYIFKATAAPQEFYYKGEAVSTPVDGANGLRGTLTGINDGSLEGNYIIAENKFWVATESNYLDAKRAYIDAIAVNKSEPALIPGRRRVSLGAAGENAETSVDNIITSDTPVKVIENGQLIIIRNGEKFNVQGQKL